MRRVTVLLTCCLILMACQPALADDPVSPLYEARRDATLAQWDGGVEKVMPDGEDPGWWPSLNPASYCLGSVCTRSYCIGSVCLGSTCVGSGCLGSQCAGSGCVGSLCLGSACGGSICGGSACLGTTLCDRMCGPDMGPTHPADPGTSYSPLHCPER
jgi:hypothetical protein